MSTPESRMSFANELDQEDALRLALSEHLAELQELYAERRDMRRVGSDYDAIDELPIYNKLRDILEELWPIIDLETPLDLLFLLPYPEMEIEDDVIETHFAALANKSGNRAALDSFALKVRTRKIAAQGDARVMEQLNAFLRLQEAVADVAEMHKIQSRFGIDRFN